MIIHNIPQTNSTHRCGDNRLHRINYRGRGHPNFRERRNGITITIYILLSKWNTL